MTVNQNLTDTRRSLFSFVSLFLYDNNDKTHADSEHFSLTRLHA